jgi:hypothetical protein
MLTLIPFENSMAKESLLGKLTVIFHADVALRTTIMTRYQLLISPKLLILLKAENKL